MMDSNAQPLCQGQTSIPRVATLHNAASVVPATVDRAVAAYVRAPVGLQPQLASQASTLCCIGRHIGVPSQGALKYPVQETASTV